MEVFELKEDFSEAVDNLINQINSSDTYYYSGSRYSEDLKVIKIDTTVLDQSIATVEYILKQIKKVKRQSYSDKGHQFTNENI